MSNDLIKQWEILATEDIKSAKVLFKNGFYLNSCFHLQQSIEKYLKILIIQKKNDDIPYTHNLVKLSQFSEIYNSFNEEQKFLLDILNSFYINTRYPVYKKNLSLNLNKNKLLTYINKTEEFIKCLRKKMKK